MSWCRCVLVCCSYRVRGSEADASHDRQSGMWEVDPAPFSVVKGLTTGKWLQ